LVSHVRPFDPLTIEAMRVIGQPQGHMAPLQTRALSLVPMLRQQVNFLSFLDGFRMLAVVALCAVPVALLARRALSSSGASSSH
jgi:hypothetical protein